MLIPKSTTGFKQYLGDGVYADFDGYGLTLQTENGFDVTNKIYIEPDVWTKLVAYTAWIAGKMEAKKREQQSIHTGEPQDRVGSGQVDSGAPEGDQDTRPSDQGGSVRDSQTGSDQGDPS